MSNGIWGRLEWQGLFRTSFSVVSKTTEDKEQQSTRKTTKEGEEERENLFSLRNHHQKLEEDNKNLSLDPQRNHQYHHQLHHHHQAHPHQEENEEEEEDREEEEQQQEEEDLTHQHPHLHLHQQEQGFHGFYQLHQPTSLNQHQNPNLIYGRIPVSVSEEPLLLNTQNPQKKRSYFPSSSSSSPTFKNEYARLGDQKMEETQQPSSRLGVVRGGRGGGGGEIIEVQGGHIIRSTGRKDRHSKVCTAKGPRDRRVRLSAHTAIQFYDVQDRLGYDRPSKAVDWLIKKAKASIDELAELPPWRPTASTVKSSEQQRDEENNQMGIEENASQFVFQHQEQNNNNNTNFLPPSLDSDSIADTIKSFFPMAAAQSGSVSSSSSIHFQNYQTPPDLLSRTSSQTQDLRLSLQSFQDPMLLHHNQHHHHHHHHQQHHSNPSSSEQALFSTAFDVGGGSANWSDQQMPEMGRFQRILAWNPNTDSSGVGGGGGGGGGFIFNSPPPPQQPPPSLPVFSGQNPLFLQRGPLQSSNSPSIRAWNIDPSMITPTDHYQNLNTIHHHQSSSISGTGFTTSGFSGFRIPARIQGEEEEHDAAATSNNQQQSSASRQ